MSRITLDIYDVHHVGTQRDFPFMKENTLFHTAKQTDTLQGFVAMGTNDHS